MVPWCSLFLRCSFSHIPYPIFFESRISLIAGVVLQSIIDVVSFCCLYMWHLVIIPSGLTGQLQSLDFQSVDKLGAIWGAGVGLAVFWKPLLATKKEPASKLSEKESEAWKKSPESTVESCEELYQQHLSWEHKDETLQNSYLWLCSEK